MLSLLQNSGIVIEFLNIVIPPCTVIEKLKHVDILLGKGNPKEKGVNEDLSG